MNHKDSSNENTVFGKINPFTFEYVNHFFRGNLPSQNMEEEEELSFEEFTIMQKEKFEALKEQLKFNPDKEFSEQILLRERVFGREELFLKSPAISSRVKIHGRELMNEFLDLLQIFH